MDVDILKPNTGFLTVERPSASASAAASTPNSASHSKTVSSGSATPETPDSEHARRYAEPVSEGEEDEDMDMAPARDEGKRMGLSVEEAAGAIAFRERMLKERMRAAAAASSSPGNGRNGVASHANGAGEGPSAIHSEDEGEEGDWEEEGDERTPFLAGKNRRASRTGSNQNQNGNGNGTVERPAIKLNINPLAPSTEVYDKVKTALEEQEQNRSRSRSQIHDGEQHNGEGDDLEEGGGAAARARARAAGDDRILVNDVVAPKGKRVAIPIRIEPKVYFATERTFLVSSPPFLLHPTSELTHTAPFIYHRNGSTSQSTSAPSPQPFSISFPQKTTTASSPPHSSPSPRSSPSSIPRVYSCTGR